MRIPRVARALGLIATASASVGTAVPLASAQRQVPVPYRDSTVAIDMRVRDLIARMTLDEKFWQLYMTPGSIDDSTHDYRNGAFGLQIAATASVPWERAARAHATRINAIQRFFVEQTRLAIPIIPFDETLHGLTREGATVFPQAIALAATWDTALVTRVAAAVARETRSRGIRQVLSPVVNIASDVRWGRVEETYGEDPFLTSALGRAFVAAFERAGIVATPKHFVANVGDGGRDSYPIDLSPRLLEEVHFPPFLSAIRQAGARSVMTAYNSVDGSPATQNPALLNGTLKRDWGFTGFVISDAAATGGATVLHHTEANTASAATHALEAGLDVIFQSTYEQHRPYLDAFRRGLISDSVIDAAVARVLRAKFELGLFERPYVSPDSAAHWNRHADHVALAREAARASIVLLRNEGNVLPLRATSRSIAIIGVDAAEARLGGYTAPGATGVSILEAIRARLADRVTVRYAPGPGRLSPAHATVPAEYLATAARSDAERGLSGEYFANTRLSGTPAIVRRDPQVDFGWTLNSPGRGIPFDWYSVRWVGTIKAPPDGVRMLGVEGNDGWRLWLGDSLLIDNWRKQSFGTRMAEVGLAPGSTHQIRLEYFESTGNARIKLVWDVGVTEDWSARIDSAAAIADDSDVAIVVAGIEEGEFRDRAFLRLPGHQEELIERVMATGTPVVVVLIGGSAVTMAPWLDDVAAVLDAWYPGEAGGHAVVEVLFGDVNPAGRLPITFPIAEGQLPLIYNHKPTGRGDDYLDLTGQPLFPFGFGLSYTTFEYSNLAIEPDTLAAGGTALVRLTVKNTGAVAGDEVVQLYVRDILASVALPVMELRGFARIHLAPGEAREVVFPLGPEHLRMLDGDMRWVLEPGAFRVMLGASSKDIRLRGSLVVQPH
jgi:beta-glucosidase